MNYYERHLGDYATDTGHLSALQHGIYGLLLDRYYKNEGPIPDSLAASWAKSKREDVLPILQEFFIPDGESWRNKRADEEIAKYRGKVEAASRAGKASAHVRATAVAHKPNERATDVQRSLNGGSTHQTPDTRQELKASTPNGVEVLVAEDKCPVQQIIDLYHESLTGLPRLKVLTAARRQTIRQRFREDLPSLVHWSRFFSHVAQSDFLMGRTEPRPGQRRFVADLEWLTKAGNFAKIAEGKYHAA